MEIRISKKLFNNPALWLGVIVVVFLVLNVVQFIHPFRMQDSSGDVKEIVVNRTVYETCPEPDITKDDLDKLWDKCMTKFDELSKEQKDLMVPATVECEYVISTKRKAEVDNPIRASSCYKDQIGIVPSSMNGSTFTTYKEIDIEKICGEDVYGFVNIRIEDALKKKTLFSKEIPFTYEDGKVKCDEIVDYDFESYDPNA